MDSTAPRASTRASLGRALQHRNYRLFFLGQGVSLIGSWITRIATSWLVYRLTGSALMLGLVGFAGQIPTLLLAPFTGVLVDRWNRHRVLVVTQALAMLQSAALAALAFTDTVTVGWVLALSVVQGVINTFDMPARQALVIDMVEDRAHLGNAIALNSSLVNGARLIGPAIAGVLIAAFGEGWCFAIDAVSYLAVLGSLAAMRLRPRPRRSSTTSIGFEMREGFLYVARSAPIRSLLLLLAAVSLTGVPYLVLMPVFARGVLGGGPDLLGLLMGATGLGALTGALWLASRVSVLGLGRVLVVAGHVFGLGLIGFSQAEVLWLSVPLLAITGAGMMVVMASCNTLVQTLVDEDKRGRVMSLYSIAFFGMTPLGSLAAGWCGDAFGAPTTVLGGGLATLLAITVFARKLPALRQLARPARPIDAQRARPAGPPPA